MREHCKFIKRILVDYQFEVIYERISIKYFFIYIFLSQNKTKLTNSITN